MKNEEKVLLLFIIIIAILLVTIIASVVLAHNKFNEPEVAIDIPGEEQEEIIETQEIKDEENESKELDDIVSEIVEEKPAIKGTEKSTEIQSTETKKTNSTSNNTNTTPKTDEPSTSAPKVEEKQPERCTNANNHGGIGLGNSGKWFNTKADAIAEYTSKINYWGAKWESFEIDTETYDKNCPSGYEVWSCPFCGKWTINYYYR